MTDHEELSGDFKTRAGRWLFAQGASTVLLFAILAACSYGAFKGLPALMEQHNQDMKELRDKNALDLKQTRDDYRATLTEQRTDFMEAIKRCEDRHKG